MALRRQKYMLEENSVSLRGSGFAAIEGQALVNALFSCNFKRMLKELNYNVKGVLELVLADNEIISLVGLQYFEGLRILDLSYNRIGTEYCYLTNRNIALFTSFYYKT